MGITYRLFLEMQRSHGVEIKVTIIKLRQRQRGSQQNDYSKVRMMYDERCKMNDVYLNKVTLNFGFD